jgi:hypothetical protein
MKLRTESAHRMYRPAYGSGIMSAKLGPKDASGRRTVGPHTSGGLIAVNEIFLSYRRADERGTTGRLFDHLVAAFGQDAIFYDVEKIPRGVDFRVYIDQTIAKCRSVLVVIGPRWLGAADQQGRRRLDLPNDPVRIEIESALRARKPIIPVLIDDAGMPDAAALPATIQQLAPQNAAPIHNNQYFEQDINGLIDALARRGVPRVRQGYISNPPSAGFLSSAAARRIGTGLVLLYVILILAGIGAVGVAAYNIVPLVAHGLQQANQQVNDGQMIAALEDDFCTKFNHHDFTGAYADLTPDYQQRVGSPSNLPTAVGGQLGSIQFTATRCQRTLTPFVSGTTATDLVQVDVTSSTFGSTTTNRQFTSAKSQGSWKIDNIAL